MTSDRPNLPDRDRATWQAAIICGGVILLGAIAAWGLSRRIATTIQPTPDPPVPQSSQFP